MAESPSRKKSSNVTEVGISFIDRTLANLRVAWRDIAVSTLRRSSNGVRPDLPTEDRERLRKQMAECLEARGGEVSARARAADLGRVYLSLSAAGKRRFLETLAADLAVDRAQLDAAIERLRGTKGEKERLRAERQLREALVPPRMRLLTQFNDLPEGVKFLVDLRGDLLKEADRSPALADLDADLKDLLTSWFDIGFLDVKRITWSSPAALLEKLIRYEAVHEIRSWGDLKNRLDSDRRCYAFFHPRMPDEPLIFIEVALVEGIADNVQALLDEGRPAADPRLADGAIFYSISNTQPGLAGISFGGFLIKRVAEDLKNQFPRLRHFATLSPIPGFRHWLLGAVEAGGEALLTPAEIAAIATAAGAEKGEVNLKSILAGAWWDKPALSDALKRPLMRLCARYLVVERQAERLLDPVARFHLRNGARVERINWLGDRSPKGYKQSAGMMVNYLYRLADLEANHEAFTGEGKVAMSSSVRALVKG